MEEIIRRLAKSSWVHVMGAFLLMGSWAFYANAAHPWPKPFLAALLQGGISASITFMLKRCIEMLAARLSGLIALFVPPVAACLTSFFVLTTIHVAANTPEVILTIALPLSVATIYASLYNLGLWKNGKSANG